MPPGYVGGGYKRYLERLKQGIHQNVAAEPGAGTGAEKSGLSISALAPLFKEQAIRTSNQYVTDAGSEAAF